MGKIKKVFMMCILSVMILAIMPTQQASADEGDIYTVTYNLTGVDASPQETEVIEGSGLDLVFTADSGYVLPDEISVQMAGEEMSNYIYESGNLIINEVYGDLVITANGVLDDEYDEDDNNNSDSDVYNISYDLYEVTASKQEGSVRAGTKYSVKLKANSGFRLDPLNVAVRVNGDYVASGYSYNEGLLEIDSVNGDIVIEAIAVQKASSKNNNNTNNNDTSNSTSGKKTSNQTSNTSSKSSSSKSAQALSNSGGSAKNYSTGSYRAPKTGDNGIDIRYYGVLALIFIGTGFVIAGKKGKKDLE